MPFSLYRIFVCHIAEGQELDSPKNVIAPRPKVSSPVVAESAPVPQSRRSRFAALAANINSWEDDTNHPVHRKEEVGSVDW